MNPSYVPYLVGILALSLLGVTFKVLRDRLPVAGGWRFGALWLGQMLTVVGILAVGIVGVASEAASSGSC